MLFQYELMRRLRYYLWYWWRNWFRLPLSLLVRCGYRFMGGITWFDGIMILDASIRGKDRAKFNADTIAALQLIKSFDPRRFRRIQREVKIIANEESLGFHGVYHREGRVCNIDYSRFKLSESAEWNAWLYASLLVHEATHGLVYSNCIGYTPKLRSRIERLCHTEQRRFVQKADTPDCLWSETLLGPFDEANWHDSWNLSFAQKWKRGARIIREALKDSKKGLRPRL